MLMPARAQSATIVSVTSGEVINRAALTGGHVLHTSETGMAENVRGVGIYGDNVIAATKKFLEQGYAETAGLARNADHCNAFLCQEFIDGLERSMG
jgi:hypothetical protein